MESESGAEQVLELDEVPDFADIEALNRLPECAEDGPLWLAAYRYSSILHYAYCMRTEGWLVELCDSLKRFKACQDAQDFDDYPFHELIRDIRAMANMGQIIAMHLGDGNGRLADRAHVLRTQLERAVGQEHEAHALLINDLEFFTGTPCESFDRAFDAALAFIGLAQSDLPVFEYHRSVSTSTSPSRIAVNLGEGKELLGTLLFLALQVSRQAVAIDVSRFVPSNLDTLGAVLRMELLLRFGECVESKLQSSSFEAALDDFLDPPH